MIKNTISDITNGIIQTIFLIADTAPSITNSIGDKTNNPIINNPFISTSVKPSSLSSINYSHFVFYKKVILVIQRLKINFAL